LLASAFSLDINSLTPSTIRWRTSIALDTSSDLSQHDDEPA
jgi:hypothetical protein